MTLCICIYKGNQEENRGTSTKYTLMNPCTGGEQLVEETMTDIINDPFNKIKGSLNGPRLISIAECFMKNRDKCNVEKLHASLSLLWNAVSAGDSKKYVTAKHEKMWQALHFMCSNSSFIEELKSYLCPALRDQHPSTIFIQTLVRKLFEKIIILKSGKQSGSEATESPKEITNVEESILRYAAGYVPFALKKKCKKRQCPESDVQIKYLNAIGVMSEVEDPQSFLEYTKCWIAKQNRGGLFQLKNEAYLFFRSIECRCREYFQKKHIKTMADTTDIKSPVLNAIYKDQVVKKHWQEATTGQDPTQSNEVMQMCIKLWVDIRGHAFATHWVEHFKHLQTIEASSKKSLRKNLKNAEMM